MALTLDELQQVIAWVEAYPAGIDPQWWGTDPSLHCDTSILKYRKLALCQEHG